MRDVVREALSNKRVECRPVWLPFRNEVRTFRSTPSENYLVLSMRNKLSFLNVWKRSQNWLALLLSANAVAGVGFEPLIFGGTRNLSSHTKDAILHVQLF